MVTDIAVFGQKSACDVHVHNTLPVGVLYLYIYILWHNTEQCNKLS